MNFSLLFGALCYEYIYFTNLDKTWSKPEVEGDFVALNSAQTAVKDYKDQPFSGCPADFQIVSEGDGELCWGGYVIIGVAVGAVVIIVIIVGVCYQLKFKP